MSHPVRRLLAASGLALACLFVLAGTASAHVTVNPSSAPQGGYAKLTFRVPTESDTASTVTLEIALPAEITSVRVKPHPGWSYQIQRSGEDATGVTWTADDGVGIGRTEFDEFDLSIGPLPDTDQVVFKALQTYSDGSVVRWIEEAADGQAEPEHPAPVLTLTPASETTASTTDDDNDGDSDSKAPLILSIVALVVAVAGAGAGLVRRRG
ncbi:YcnI family protein [Nocardioides sp.]|uniref:YcnI family copper-binding membrane protein n=1 Tax=Nocardioides sp. TaxID=35761 RepID=UPI0039E54933